MSHDPGASDGLRALLLQLMAESNTRLGKALPRTRSSTLIKHTSTAHAKAATPQNTSPGELPDYGFGDLEEMACTIIGVKGLTTLAQIVQQHCRLMGDFKRSDECIAFLHNTCGQESPKLNLNHATLSALGSPEVEIALILYQYSHETKKSLLPPPGATVIASVATAGSGRPSEWATLLAAIGIQYDLHTVKTVLTTTHQTGRTGEKIQADDESVTYDELAPRDTWPAVSQDLYQQLCRTTGRNLNVAAIFHWGCISHHDGLTPNGDVVEDWAHHEHWNMLYCIAMARHALDVLATGGTLVLKVRIFKDGRTHHLVALLACAFEDFRIFENSRMPAEFAAFVGLRFKGRDAQDVKTVQKILAKCISYDEVSMTSHDLIRDPTYVRTLEKASAVRRKMDLHHQHVAFLMHYIIYWISEACGTPPARVDFDYAELDLELQRLQKDAPVWIDDAWIPDIKRRIQTIIKNMTPADLFDVCHYVRQFHAEKFKK